LADQETKAIGEEAGKNELQFKAVAEDRRR
jgi:hypothetical protein